MESYDMAVSIGSTVHTMVSGEYFDFMTQITSKTQDMHGDIS